MAHDSDVIREIVTDLDRIIAAVQRIRDRSAGEDRQDAGLAVVKFREARFWLTAIGHGTHHDTPEPETKEGQA